uniref:Uncharacterized protein n=1 Tax=Anguilla anguilla TaxID=7936 RepID=A0A0E9XP01_ANGAN
MIAEGEIVSAFAIYTLYSASEKPYS